MPTLTPELRWAIEEAGDQPIRLEDPQTKKRDGRVEGWRVCGRVRWLVHGFRRGPQSGSHGHVSSPRHLERSVQISRTALSCPLRDKGYVAPSAGGAFGRGV